MNCCSCGNNYLWILIILVILGTCGNVFSSSAFRGCGWPLLAALAYCMCKNGTLQDLVNRMCGGSDCGCNYARIFSSDRAEECRAAEPRKQNARP